MNILIVGNDYHELVKIAREAETTSNKFFFAHTYNDAVSILGWIKSEHINPEKIDGIITYLNFRRFNESDFASGNLPFGLVMMFEARTNNIPCVLCVDIDPNNNDGWEYRLTKSMLSSNIIKEDNLACDGESTTAIDKMAKLLIINQLRADLNEPIQG
ncbi:MAG: hypothetical protein WCG01_02190 [bacterium]